jgi:hypothetical protein
MDDACSWQLKSMENDHPISEKGSARFVGLGAATCQKQTHAPQQKKRDQFDHVGGGCEQRRRNGQTEAFAVLGLMALRG